MVLGLFVEQKRWAARSRSVSLYIHSTLNTIFAWIFRSRWERWITWTSWSTWETRPCRLVYDTFQLQIEQFFLFFVFFFIQLCQFCNNKYNNNVLPTRSIWMSRWIWCCIQQKVQQQIRWFILMCVLPHFARENVRAHIRCLARRKTVAILRSYNRIYKSTMRSFIACQIANKRSRVQNGFDQILPKRSGYEIKFRIW